MRTGGRFRILLFCFLFLMWLVAGIPLAPPAAAEIVIAGAPTIAADIATNPDVVDGASFVASPNINVAAVSDTALAGFPTSGDKFGILSTGDAHLADDANTSETSGVGWGGGAIRGDTDRDVTILKIDLTVPDGANCLQLDFRFLTEEFPEYVGQQYNDAFIAELDTSDWTTSGSTISAPQNFAFGPGNAPITVNTTGALGVSATNASGTTYDGSTPILRAAKPVTPGPHSVFLSIFDQGDDLLDSAVFVDRLVIGTQAPEQCTPGAGEVPVGGGDCEIVGTKGDDVLGGTLLDDVICGLGGDDQIVGLGGSDTIRGGGGNDTLIGDDPLDPAARGLDELFGGRGDDRLVWGPGGDTMRGGPGHDLATFVLFNLGASGVEVLFAQLAGEYHPRDESIVGEGGFLFSIERVTGSERGDFIGLLVDSSLDAVLRGLGGDDDLQGDLGDDRLFGGPGNDRLRAGGGSDFCNQGPGTDPDFATAGSVQAFLEASGCEVYRGYD